MQGKKFVIELTAPVDTIVIGRKLAEGFIPYWADAITKPETADIFARQLVNIPKVVFSNTLEKSIWATRTGFGMITGISTAVHGRSL